MEQKWSFWHVPDCVSTIREPHIHKNAAVASRRTIAPNIYMLSESSKDSCGQKCHLLAGENFAKLTRETDVLSEAIGAIQARPRLSLGISRCNSA